MTKVDALCISECLATLLSFTCFMSLSWDLRSEPAILFLGSQSKHWSRYYLFHKTGQLNKCVWSENCLSTSSTTYSTNICPQIFFKNLHYITIQKWSTGSGVPGVNLHSSTANESFEMLHLKQAIWLSSDCFCMLAVVWLKRKIQQLSCLLI